MTGFPARAPLLRGYEPRSVITWRDGQPLSAQAFCGAALAMSQRLPHARHGVNLCERPPCFLLAGAAAWLAGQTLLLPSDRLARSLARLHDDFPDAYCIADSPGVAEFARASGMDVFIVDQAPGPEACWPPPEIALSHRVAYLHTSGSTGAPARHAKTWGELVAGTATLLRSFGSPGPAAAILGTVAPQHMFGLETTIMLPLQSGTPLLPQQPALPADLGDALREARVLGRDGIWLMTTPLQLQAFHAARAVTGLERIITSTMPLDPALASAVERDWRVAVEEIYGCTEGGMLALRRPALASTFSTGAGLSFAVGADGHAIVQGGHLPSALTLADRIEIVPAASAGARQQFRLLGRDDDMVKIAGKRASLAGLTQVLRGLAGVQDGVFFRSTPDARRLCAVVVAPGVSEALLRRALAAAIDPAFRPRPLRMVDRIPRGIGMKIDVAALREMIADPLRGKPPAKVPLPAAITACMAVAPTHPAFAGHFPGRPIVPGVLLLEQVEAELAARGLALCECSSLKFHATVGPGDPVAIHIDVTADASARFRLTRNGDPVASGACRCIPMAAA